MSEKNKPQMSPAHLGFETTPHVAGLFAIDYFCVDQVSSLSIPPSV